MTITTRADKGAELTHAELDENFTDFRDGVNILLPSDSDKGMKIDPLDPDFGWEDMTSALHIDENDPNAPQYALYIGTRIKVRQFLASTSEGLLEFHFPHDYKLGTPVFVHVHWSHDSDTVTGGSCTWGFELVYAKGHDQGEFSAPIVISIAQTASLIKRRHMIAETIASSIGGSATTLDTDNLEVDGVISGAIFLDSNDLVDSVSTPDPFVHFVDFHYQSTGMATKNKAPNFYG